MVWSIGGMIPTEKESSVWRRTCITTLFPQEIPCRLALFLIQSPGTAPAVVMVVSVVLP